MIFNFQSYGLTISHYYLSVTSKNPIKWILEGTYDEKKWIVLDQKEFGNITQVNTIVDFFEIKQQSDFNIFALTVEGSSEYYIKKLDFFGKFEGQFANINKEIQAAKKIELLKDKIEIPYSDRRPDGLFSYLSLLPFQKFSAICEIESSFSSKNSDVLNLLLWDNSSWFPIEQSPENSSNCNILIQFWFNWGFFMTGYRFRSADDNFPVNWEIIGITLKGEKEEVLDSQSNSKALSSAFAEKKFSSL